MTDQQARKLNLPLYLNGTLSRSDGEAMVALQQWYEKAQQSCSGRAELESMIHSFHRDLYLAGLRLYQINPRLCRQVAETLEQRDMTLEKLAQQLSACGLWVESQEKRFSVDQLKQLEGLLAAANSETSGSAEGDKSSALSKQLTEQKTQLTAMQAELEKLRVLAEEQAQQLRQMKLAAPKPASRKAAQAGGAEEMDVSHMTANIAKMKKVRGKGVF